VIAQRAPLTLVSARLLDGAPATWLAMLQAIDGARESIHLEVYAFRAGGVGEHFVRRLAAARARGVRVRVIVDGWGSHATAAHVTDELRAAGCDATVFNPLRFGFLGRLRRNHRKLLLVDRRTAILGGINVGDEFTDWDDVAVELRGPACEPLARRLDGERFVPQEGPVRIHLSRYSGGRLRRMYAKAFASARTSLRVAHGYFLPDRNLVRRLSAAARRGVDVELLLPARSDVPLVQLAAAIHDRRLVAAGVRIAEHTRSILHSKLAVVDGRRLLIGSFNLDPLSMTMLESLVIIDDPAIARAGSAWIEQRFAAGRRVSRPAVRWWRLLIGWLVAALARLLGRLLE
jgi:cardiolipin synthase